MSESNKINPYASPVTLPDTPSDPKLLALRLLRGPSLGLLILEGLVAIVGIVFLPLIIFGTVMVHFFPTFPGGRVDDLIAIPIFLTSYPVFFGAWNMRNGKRYRWAYSAAVLACIPMPSPFIIFNIPLGIWALILLHRRDVKEAFARNAENQAQKIGGHEPPVG